MLNNAVCFKNIYIVTGYTDLRFGIDSLAVLIESMPGSKPFVPDTLYLFCGRRTDRINLCKTEKFLCFFQSGILEKPLYDNSLECA